MKKYLVSFKSMLKFGFAINKILVITLLWANTTSYEFFLRMLILVTNAQLCKLITRYERHIKFNRRTSQTTAQSKIIAWILIDYLQ
jgi:hypothetical protein